MSNFYLIYVNHWTAWHSRILVLYWNYW